MAIVSGQPLSELMKLTGEQASTIIEVLRIRNGS